MEGQSEGISKKKARTKNAIDVACQTDQSTSSTSSSRTFQQNTPQSSSSSASGTSAKQATSANAAASTSPATSTAPGATVPSATSDTSDPKGPKFRWEFETKQNGGSGSGSSTSASGDSPPGIAAVISNPSSVNTSTQATNVSDKKLPGPAGVKPNEIEAYFGEKKPPSTTAAPSTPALAVPPGQTTQAKTRASSTTSVASDGKKQARSNVSPAAATNTTTTQAPAPNAGTAVTNSASSSTASNGTSAAKSDGPSWSDENCKLRLVINRFSHLEETMCSPPKSIEGVSWKIMVMPKQHMVQKKQQKCMGFFLQCAPERAYSDQWSVHAIADMRMISYKPNIPHFARRTTHTYTSKENDWGYSCFMTWADIIDESQGYIRDDTVVLEIAVKAEPPKNMMSHEDFLEKIEKWIVLADMQMKKGNIDLALEANQSALKFCKGKDEECYTRLETQRETFVNAKLFESIERIEKGPVVSTDTTNGKPTSLRQALTGAQKSLNGKMTAKGGKKTRAVVTVQHMKKKKTERLEQNNTTQQRTNSGPTAKDASDNRKNSKSEEASKKDALRSKEDEEELDEESATSESEGSPEDEKATVGSEEEDEDADFDDEEYAEGDYPNQADDCSMLEDVSAGPPGSVSATATRSEVIHEVDEEEEEEEEAEEEEEDQEDVEQTEVIADWVMGDSESNQPNESELRDREKYRAARLLSSTDMGATVLRAGSSAPIYVGRGDENVKCFDRMCQTDFGDVTDGQQLTYDDARYTIAACPAKFTGPDEEKANINSDMFYNRMGFVSTAHENIEQVFGSENTESDEYMSTEVLNSLPRPLQIVKNGDPVCALEKAEKSMDSWVDIEKILFETADPDGIFSRLSDKDRKDLIAEVAFKFHPVMSSFDMEFRETVHFARNFLVNTRNAFDESQKAAAECEDLKKNFEEKIANGFIQKEPVKRQVDTVPVKKTVTSAAATSGSSTPINGRPTVIAKRSMKQPVQDDTFDEATRGRVNELLRSIDFTRAACPPDDLTRDMAVVHAAFQKLNIAVQPMINNMCNNNRKVQKFFSDMVADNGVITKHIKEIISTNCAKINSYQMEIKTTKDALVVVTEERDKFEKLAVERERQFNGESERHAKTQKEVKDLKNLLKKAESKGTKEENRATNLQVQLNDLDEKAKCLRKELETLKKKSADERAKAKKEKDRDTQTIRQQSIEISERENERDKARKEVEESNRGKDKVEKEKKAVATQLAAMTERARSAEVGVMESRWNIASEEIKKRKEAAQNGYTETEGLASRVRQVADRDIVRKSLAEWKAALDKCDSQMKSLKLEYDHAIDQIKSGVKTLAQTLEIKLPAADPLPKLVKPPPVQVVAPSASVIPPPVIPPTPAAGVIGQQRTPISRQIPQAAEPASACSTPSRSRVERVPSPVLKTSTRSEEAPLSLWSWNTIGNLGDLRPSSRNESFPISSMDSLQRDIWTANGNGNGSLGPDFLRGSSASMNGMGPNQGPPSSPFLRHNSQPGVPSNQQAQSQQAPVGMSQGNYASQQSQMQQNNQRMHQQQQQRGYGDMWNGQNMQQNSGNQEYGNGRMMSHNGGGDLANGQGYSPWHNPPPPIGNQLRGPTSQQSAGGHHNMFQSHSFFDNGM